MNSSSVSESSFRSSASRPLAIEALKTVRNFAAQVFRMGERFLVSGVASRRFRLRDVALHLHGFLQSVDHLRQRAGCTLAVLRRQTFLLFELGQLAVDGVVDALDERARFGGDGFDFAFAEGPARGLAVVFVDAAAIIGLASASSEVRAAALDFVAVFFSVPAAFEVPRFVFAAPSLVLELSSSATGVFAATTRETARRALDAAAMHL
jgi:hypothetical protein